ncbi:MAG: PH domain-containing protein [Clostridiales bacterium]|jgi:hypothetical protein|nr:PH domain-containing protein [Clostridiales bacterium]
MTYSKLKLKNSKTVNTLALLASIILAALAVVCIVTYERATLTGAVISSAVCFVLSALSAVTAFYARYVFEEKGFAVRFGYFGFHIAYGDMRLIRKSGDTNELFLIYLKKGSLDDIRCLKILIDPKNETSFVTKLREKNSLIVFEIFYKNDEFEGK